jgi:pimeloyl-ACP methyl ester carboxylesterase
VARKAVRDPSVVPTLFNDLSPVDQQVLERPELLALMASLYEETFRNGTRGAVHDIKLEGRPWKVDLGAIEAPTAIWHGAADTIVPPLHAEVLAAGIDGSELHVLEGEGHLSMRVDKIGEVLRRLA